MMKIDFVLTWVDGNDPKWQEDFAKYKDLEGDSRKSRYRDWSNLQYLFRAFEQFTPWVNKIYFVTYGHLPKWLDASHPKLIIVRHEDFMNPEDLPVFNINPIEINFHRIKDLSEHFVYFNDDTFITAALTPERFFKKGLPVGTAISHIMHVGEIRHIISNNLEVLNRHFDKHASIRKHLWKWFYPGYGIHLYRTLCLLPWKVFTGFYNYHHPQPMLKRTYNEVWEKEPELMAKVSRSKFRHSDDVSQYLFRYWQFAKGDFYPASYAMGYKKSKYVEISTFEDAKKAADDIAGKKYELYCPNDNLTNVDDEIFEASVNVINQALDSLLPAKSKFEK